MPLYEGQTVGSYQIIGQLGQGGMATVYKAYHAKLDRYVAIKVMHQAFMEDPNFQARFEREAQIVARLEHPNIVPVYDYSEFERQPYLVMKFIEGHTLKSILSSGRLSTEQILYIMTTIASALTYAHQQGVLHRDIKPSNIVLDKTNVPYLTDFGLARIAQAGESTMSHDFILGTPQYISPEQARGEKNLDARTDVYSFGVVLYEMVVGRVPFNADTPYAIVHDHIYSPLPTPSSLNPAIPPQVEQVLIRALAKNPAERYDSAVELMTAFRQAVEQTSFIGDEQPIAQRLNQDPPTVNLPAPPQGYVSIPAVPTRPQMGFAPPPVPSRPPSPFENQPGKPPTLQADFGNLGEQIESKVRQGVSYFTDIAHSVEAAVREQTNSNSEEDRIRRKIEKRYKERQGLIIHFITYLIINGMFWFMWATQIAQRVTSEMNLPAAATEGMNLPWPIFVTLFWGIGMVSHFLGYWSKYGPGADRREREIQREIARQRETSAAYEKPKNDQRRVRLTDDGELEDVLEDEDSRYQKRKRDQSARRERRR